MQSKRNGNPQDPGLSPAGLPQDIEIPWPGNPWPGIEGSLYAGLCPGDLASAPYHLVLLREEPEQRLTWKAGMEWARAMGADLPTRNESAFLYAFHRHLFDDRFWHWTGTQWSSSNAWLQGFGSGSQGISGKSYEARCRAVRRFSSSTLQSFEGEARVAEAA